MINKLVASLNYASVGFTIECCSVMTNHRLKVALDLHFKKVQGANLLPPDKHFQ